MFDHEALLNELKQSPVGAIAEELVDATNTVLRIRRHGFYDRWRSLVNNLPAIVTADIDLNRDAPRIGDSKDFDSRQTALLQSQLMQFKPWRKGPFEMFGVYIDAEWRSDQKWKRLADRIHSPTTLVNSRVNRERINHQRWHKS